MNLLIYLRKTTKSRLFRISLILALVIVSGQTFAQGNVKVTGTVKGGGDVLIGASVTEKGTNNGTMTDMDGKFILTVKPNATLVVVYVGFEPLNVVVGNKHNLDIELKESSNVLNEVVAIGYGVQKKKLTTGASVSLKGEDLQKMNTTNALQAMQGQTAGVNITSTSGQPGGGIKVNIRGVGTIGNSDPTYVVDGVITGDITYLNNADIASIDVLKDAASCAIYGVNGANGVVLITTRGGGASGGASKGKISVDSYFGVQNVARKANLLNAKEYAILVNEGAVNSGKQVYFTQSQIDAMGTGTNWMDQMFAKDVPTQNINIAANGGGDASTYSLAFSYTDQGGIVGGKDLSDYQRYNFRVNTEHKMYGDFLKLGEHITYSHINQKGVKDGDQYNNSLRSALSTTPFLPMYDSNGSFVNSSDYAMYYYDSGALVDKSWYNGEANPYASMLYTNQNQTRSDKLLGDVYAELQLLKGLKFKSTFGFEYNGTNYHSYLPVYSLSIYDFSTSEKITQTTTASYTWNWDNTINYNLSLKDHNFDFLLGSSLRRYEGSWLTGANTGSTLFSSLGQAYLSNSTITSVSASSDPQTVTNTLSLTGNAYSVTAHKSYFGRINYNYKETYMATVVIRADGSTYFAKGNQWGYFPSVSAGWVMSNENFMKPTNKWLDFLKIRASWGNNGNDKISKTFAYESLITLSNATYNIGGTDVAGSYPSTIGTSGLKWETSRQLDLGFDSRLLGGKLNLNFDWYKKTTKDWLVQAPVYGTTGVSSNPYINGGDVDNAGAEIMLSYSDRIGKDFKYTISGTYTYNKNTVNHIPTSDGIIHGGTNILYDNATEFFRAESGHPLGYFWGYKTAGIFQTTEEVSSNISNGQVLQPTALPGDVKYVDLNKDGVIDSNDKTDIGDPNPHHLFGMSLSFSYKDFDFSLAGSGVSGNKIVQSYRNIANRYGNYTNAFLARWHGEGTSNSMPRLTEDNANWANFSDLYIHDGAYFRINNVTLGYDFTKMMKCKYISQCRLYVAAENLITFTKYDGMDPEVGFSAQGSNSEYNFGQGVDVGFYPRPRTCLLGLNLKF